MDSLVIVSNSGENSLGIARLTGQTGALSKIKTLPFPDVSGPSGGCPLAVSPDRKMLYLSFRGTPSQVLSFEIDYITGVLEYRGRSALPDSMVHISTDETGRFLFSASYGGGILAVSVIEPDGIVGEVVQICEAELKAHCTVVMPDNSFVLVPSIDAEAILRFSFDAETGQIRRTPSPAATVPTGAGPRHLVLNPNQKTAFLVNEINGTVTVFSVGEKAEFTAIQTVDITATDFNGTPSAADIHLTPDGNFLYASDRGSNTIAGYRVDPLTGKLNEVCKVSVASTPRGFNIDPTGNWLLSAAQDEGTITVYGIEPHSGMLRLQQICEIGKGPNWVEILSIPLKE